MRKSLKRVLDRLRARTTDAFRQTTAVRGGLHQLQTHGVPAPAIGRS